MTSQPMPQPVRLGDLIEHVIAQHPEGEPLQHLADAVAVSAHLGEVSDHLIGHFVDQARRAGASWTDIGQYMGVTKQAVQKRFVPNGADIDETRRGLFGRFTQRARNAIMVARTEALERGHADVRNEHIVLGLLSEPEGFAAQAIVALGPNLETVRAAVLDALGPAQSTPKLHRVRFSRNAKKTLELSLREALQHGHNYVGTEHVLLGLLRNDRDPAAILLTGLGVSRERADVWLRGELADFQEAKKDGRKRRMRS